VDKCVDKVVNRVDIFVDKICGQMRGQIREQIRGRVCEQCGQIHAQMREQMCAKCVDKRRTNPLLIRVNKNARTTGVKQKKCLKQSFSIILTFVTVDVSKYRTDLIGHVFCFQLFSRL